MFKNPLAAVLLLLAPLMFVIASCGDVLGVDFGAAHLGLDGSANADGAVANGEGGACMPRTCDAQGFQCGTQDDGCGNALECGTCKTGVCTDGKCACVPKTCPELKAQCGKLDNGCGGLLDCGSCPNASDACDSTTNTCACKPKTCADQGAACGTVPDGCGGTYDCGGCVAGSANPYCSAGKCGATPCSPTTCAAEGKNCGQISDGCLTVLTCTPGCTGSQTCGGSGVANVCGCTPKTCAQLGDNCGTPADGCGGTAACPTCTSPQTCGGGGATDVCGCTPTNKCPIGSNCGTASNGCSGLVSCGVGCTLPQSCGGGGAPNFCGCTPNKCLVGDCGIMPNGCGGSLNCGTCGGGGGGGCFAEETPVLMADGSMRAIASLKPGDMIMGYDAVSGETIARPVDRVLVHSTDASADGLVLIDGDIRATRNHPILSGGRAVRADNLKAGDVMHMAEARAAAAHVDLRIGHVTSVSIVSGGIVTYDVKTTPPGGYIVGHGRVVALQKE